MSRFHDLLNGEKAILVDFTASWCGPCKMMAPILQQVKNDLGDRITIVKVDIDRNPEAANEFGIQGVPTLLLFRKGNLLWRQSGMMPAEQLKQTIVVHTS
jgi:thioredoxin 1